MKLFKFVIFVAMCVALILATSVSSAQAQVPVSCSSPFGDMIGGTFFPSSRLDFRGGAGYPPCGADIVASLAGRYGSHDPYGVYGNMYGRGRLPAAIQPCIDVECEGLVGTYHLNKNGKELHFRPFDDTNRRIGTREAGAYGAGGGYIATRGQKPWVQGVAIVGGAIGAGMWASSNAHDNCMRITSRSQASPPRRSVQEREDEGVEESGPPASQPMARTAPQPIVFRDHVELDNEGPHKVTLRDTCGNPRGFVLANTLGNRILAPESGCELVGEAMVTTCTGGWEAVQVSITGDRVKYRTYPPDVPCRRPR